VRGGVADTPVGRRRCRSGAVWRGLQICGHSSLMASGVHHLWRAVAGRGGRMRWVRWC